MPDGSQIRERHFLLDSLVLYVKIHPAVQILCADKQRNRITNVPISHLYRIQRITALLRLDRFWNGAYR